VRSAICVLSIGLAGWLGSPMTVCGGNAQHATNTRRGKHQTGRRRSDVLQAQRGRLFSSCFTPGGGRVEAALGGVGLFCDIAAAQKLGQSRPKFDARVSQGLRVAGCGWWIDSETGRGVPSMGCTSIHCWPIHCGPGGVVGRCQSEVKEKEKGATGGSVVAGSKIAGDAAEPAEPWQAWPTCGARV
jgi:hypothetical protein